LDDTNPNDIANCLNNHFTSVGKQMADKFDCHIEHHSDPLSYIKKEVKDSIFLNYTNANYNQIYIIHKNIFPTIFNAHPRNLLQTLL